MPVVVQDTTTKKDGNGVSVAFTFAFRIFTTADILVKVDKVVQAIGTDYTVVIATLPAEGGTVTFTVAPPTGTGNVLINLDLSYSQSTDFAIGGDVEADVLDNIHDRMTLLISQVRDITDRTIRVGADIFSTTFDAVLPDPTVAPNKGNPIRYKADGTGLEPFQILVTDIATPLTTEGDLIIGVGQGLPGRLGIGTNSQQLAVKDGNVAWTDTVLSVKDYGALGDGATDDTAAIQAAIDAAESGRGSIVLFPPGNYRCLSPLTVDGDSIELRGSGMGQSTSTGATVLDLRNGNEAHILISTSATERKWIAFTNMHLYTGSAGGGNVQPLFKALKVRGLRFQNITFGGIYTFLEAGAASDTVKLLFMDTMEGNMAATHSHFLDIINIPGGCWLRAIKAEGAATPIIGAYAINHETTAIDGMQMSDCIFGLFGRGINARKNVGNWFMVNCLFDRFVTYGIFFEAGSGETIHTVIANGCQFAANDGTVVSVGAFFTELAGGDMFLININGSKFRQMGQHAIHVSGALHDVSILGNNISSVGLQTDDTYAAIRLGTSATRVSCIGNLIDGGTASNRPNYGVEIVTTDQDIIVQGNVIKNIRTAEILDATAATGFGKHVSGNTGDAPKSTKFIGPFTVTNAAQGVSDTPMSMPTGTGGEGFLGMVMPRRGRVIGISVSASAERSAGTGTFTVGVNATPGTINAVLDATNTQFDSTTQATGDVYNVGDRLSIRYVTDGSWAPATLEILAWLEIIDT